VKGLVLLETLRFFAAFRNDKAGQVLMIFGELFFVLAGERPDAPGSSAKPILLSINHLRTMIPGPGSPA
jgi:hypothetical protein